MASTHSTNTKLSRRIRLTYLVNHPITYQVPLLRRLALEPGIQLHVIFCSDFSLAAYYDQEFCTRVLWDTPLLGGYDCEFLPEYFKGKMPACLRPFNTGLYSAFTRHRPDAVWIHGWSHLTNLRAAVLAKLLGSKVLFRGESTLPISLPRHSHTKKLFYRGIRAMADGFLSIGSMNREFYLGIGVPEHQIALVPYAVDNAYFQSAHQRVAPAREDLRKSLGLAPGRQIILYSSKLTQRKRALDLLAAYRCLSDDGRSPPQPYLIFIGDGEMRGPLENAVHSLGWDSIRLLGFKNQSDLPAYYDLCDIFVLPSFDEPWGLVVNEALNFGKPVVVSDQVGCARDLVKDGYNGYIFPAGDSLQLAHALRALCTNPTQRKTFGHRGLSLINSWSYDQDVEGLHQALSALGL